MKNARRYFLAAALLSAASISKGQVSDIKPLRIIIPSAPGGTTDILARQLQEPLGKQVELPVLIDYKAGASGALGAQFVKRASPDGLTLLLAGNSLVSAPMTQKAAGYDAKKDFTPVAMVAAMPMVLLVHPSVPANNVAQLIEYAKSRPGALEFASAGRGSLGHLATELFNQMAGLKMLYVPYVGSAPATQALIAGDVKVLVTTPSNAINSFAASGKIKMLGVSSAQRSDLLPGVPSIAETLPGYDVVAWFGLVAPADTPPSVVARYNNVVNQIVGQPAVRDKLKALGMFSRPESPSKFSETFQTDAELWARVVKVANIAPE